MASFGSMEANAQSSACQLYVISPPEISNADAFSHLMRGVLSTGVVSVFQLRLKPCSSGLALQIARELFPLCRERGVLCIVNDSPQLALELGADGVHLGEDDMPVAEARKLLGEELVIGASAYNSMDCAMSLADAGADYVAFGACYPSRTKEQPRRASLSLFEQWSEQAQIASVAIGGINASNASDVASAGADYIAVCHALWSAESPATEAMALAGAISA